MAGTITKLGPSPLSTDVRWDVVHRVSSSVSFQRSPRLRELFFYICDRAIQNRPEDLREQLIGCGVFGRKPDYNPGEDNIVRVEIRQLRKRLDEYFSSEGKDEPYVIAIPKGAYVPVFEPRPVLPEVAAPPKVEIAPAHPRMQWWFWALSGVIAILTVACIWLWMLALRTEQRLDAAVHATPNRNAPWPLLINNEEPTQIVCADSTLVVAQAILHRPLTLQDYVVRDYGDKAASTSSEASALLRQLQGWQFTDMTDARLVQKLYRLNANYWDKVSVRSARTTQVQDFKIGNSILLGSNRSNLWNTLFEPLLNFRFEVDEQNHITSIRNRHPLKGEQATYKSAKTGGSGETYSVIALVPNLRHTGSVLIIEGASAEGTEAAGEFIMNPETAARLLNGYTGKSGERIPYFEALLRSGTLAGVAKNAEIVSARKLPDAVTQE